MLASTFSRIVARNSRWALIASHRALIAMAARAPSSTSFSSPRVTTEKGGSIDAHSTCTAAESETLVPQVGPRRKAPRSMGPWQSKHCAALGSRATPNVTNFASRRIRPEHRA
jgi:hypothetical protein